jgi:hypothetical protein
MWKKVTFFVHKNIFGRSVGGGGGLKKSQAEGFSEGKFLRNPGVQEFLRRCKVNTR